MKRFPSTLLLCLLTVPAFAQDAKTNAVPGSTSATNQIAPPVLILPASAGTLTAPLELKNGYISQPDTTDAGGGGKAVFSFIITNAGTYVIRGIVNAPAEDANSFYVHVDTPPADPDTMIWDIEVTDGFVERTVNWRGNGSSGSDEFDPKRFQLTAGPHKLHITGREGGAELKSVSFSLAPEH
jgi:hypothetical protein